ncbi:MAG: hypothetical protein FWG66_12190 [Spirochaetes bacterium]|nr:hypothetical protein [Spirochaetota bacterium]
MEGMKEDVKLAAASLKELNEKAAAMLEAQKEANGKLDVVIGKLPEPESRALKLIDLMAAIASVLGLIGIADIIRSWF